MQVQQYNVVDEAGAGRLRDEIVAIKAAIAHADSLLQAKEQPVPDIMDGTERSIGAIDRAMMASGYR